MAKKIAHFSLLLMAIAIVAAPFPGVGVVGAAMLRKNPLAKQFAKWALRTKGGKKIARGAVILAVVFTTTVRTLRQA